MTETAINWQPEMLEDELLQLIPLKAAHFDDLFEIAADPLIWAQHPSSDRYKKEVFQIYFDEAVSMSSFLIIDKKTDKLIGSTRFYDFKPASSSISIGYTFFARDYWGGLYNKSSKRLLINYAFQFVDKVYFYIGATNIRSQKAIYKIGAKQNREVDLDYYGKKLLHYEYMIEKNEWKNLFNAIN